MNEQTGFFRVFGDFSIASQKRRCFETRNSGFLDIATDTTTFTMPASVTGIFQRKTTDIKRRFNERAADRCKRRVAKEIAEMHALDKHYLLRNSSSEDTQSSTSNNMSRLLASSCIASSMSYGSESTASTSKVSSLYERSSCPEDTQVIHPVIYKRDIYLKPLEESSKVQPSSIQARGKMRDLDEAKVSSLPPFSLAGSMLCHEMDKRIAQGITKAPQNMYSPQRPIGLPANTIMASMLFRTLEQEEQLSLGGSDGQHPDKNEHPSILEVVTSSSSDSRSTAGSTVSAITMYSSEANSDPRMMKASKDLLAILQSNNFAAFDAKPKTTLYEA
jgi:hypothetical protein